ncbi:MAG: site-2 protease family protein, partial [Bdellovibrionaceae bacterium]|nr:site-2 protease family protein [Pseudobdellovibrionaceae bacterium]
HADLLGTVIFPLVAVITHVPLFGWAKPVPVNPRNLKTPRNDMFLVALAGPMSNVFLALVATGVLAIVVMVAPETLMRPEGGPGFGLSVARGFIYINMILAVFNLIPLHPLDGGKVLARFLPAALNDKLENAQNMSSMILLMLFVSGLLRIVTAPAGWAADGLLRFALGF